MIWLYTGTPGSGKSYHAARDIYMRLRRRKGGLITNFPVAPASVPPDYPYRYYDNSDLTPQRLVEYARAHHRVGVEGQTLIVIDECQVLYNCREFGRRDRSDWVVLLSQHRKLGYNMILITQHDRMVDRQIRALVEYEIRHRKITNYGLGGKVMSLLTLGTTWFAAVEHWYGNSLRLGTELIAYRQRIADIYDSYATFSAPLSVPKSGGATVPGGAPSGGGARGTAPLRP